MTDDDFEPRPPRVPCPAALFIEGAVPPHRCLMDAQHGGGHRCQCGHVWFPS